MFNSLLVFDLSKLKMRMLEGLAKHLEHVNEKLFRPVLVDRACVRMHPCCFGNETGITSNPGVARIADNTRTCSGFHGPSSPLSRRTALGFGNGFWLSLVKMSLRFIVGIERYN
jgi:hypothetical protein